MSDEPRERTREECQQTFLDQIRALIGFWAYESRKPDVKDKLEGLAFSILSVIDGSSELPCFKLIPDPHPDDKEFYVEEGDNWWPSGVDISGNLHERFVNSRSTGEREGK